MGEREREEGNESENELHQRDCERESERERERVFIKDYCNEGSRASACATVNINKSCKPELPQMWSIFVVEGVVLIACFFVLCITFLLTQFV